MTYKIGTKNSKKQTALLNQARTGNLPLEELIASVAKVVSSPSILSGEEEIHPDWGKWIRDYPDELLRVVSYEMSDEDAIDFDTEVVEQLIDYFDSEQILTQINPGESRVTFLLGAGASKPNPSNIPTVKELLSELLTRARKLNRDDLNRLADLCDRSQISNIEDLLTAAQLADFSSRNPNVLGLMEFLLYRNNSRPIPRPYPNPSYVPTYRPLSAPSYTNSVELASVAFLQDTLQVLFGLLSSQMLPAQPNAGHIAISQYVKSKPNSYIVTTNYDCCMDLALGEEGKDFSYSIDFANRTSTTDKLANVTPLIKLHGSLNWFYCDTCQTVNLIDIKKTVEEYIQDLNSYPVIAVCRHCGGQRRGLLVPPLAMKFDVAPPLTPLIERAQEAFINADLIVVVGFSFADADLYISRMVTKALQRSQSTRMIIFDSDISIETKMRNQLANRISNFDEKRVLGIFGDCSITLPSFLNGTLHSEFRSPRWPRPALVRPRQVLRPAPRPSIRPAPIYRSSVKEDF